MYSYEYKPGTAALIERIQAPAHTALYDYQPRGNQVRSLINHTADPNTSFSNFTLPTSQFTNSVATRHDYRYNDLGQRSSVTQSGTAYALDSESPSALGSIFDFTYNAKGEVTGAARYQGLDPDSFGPAIPSDSFTYTFDDIGNRQESTFGEKSSTYEANSLNQYATTSLSRSSEAEADVNNPIHDEDGNLLEDGTYQYTWNAENRLIAVEPLAGNATLQTSTFTYDYQGRRVSKTVEFSNFTPQTSNFLYDGWNLIAEFQTSNFTLQTSYLWGTDLSGTMQGAGGVGGLLMVTEHVSNTESEISPFKLHYSPFYSANGNIVGYFDNSSGEIAAHYEYGPFGELIRESGAQAETFRFRFSTKYEDAETGLLYYGFRYYDSKTGRWLSRDPIGEQGGVNLYGMVGNNALSFFDLLGLRGAGHHLVPYSLFDGKVSDKVFKVFDGNSARLWHPNYKFHDYSPRGGVKHSTYNKLVNDELCKFMKKHKIKDLKSMNETQAVAFVKLIKRKGKNTQIGKFNRGVGIEIRNSVKHGAPVDRSIAKAKGYYGSVLYAFGIVSLLQLSSPEVQSATANALLREIETHFSLKAQGKSGAAAAKQVEIGLLVSDLMGGSNAAFVGVMASFEFSDGSTAVAENPTPQNNDPSVEPNPITTQTSTKRIYADGTKEVLINGVWTVEERRTGAYRSN